VVATTTIWGDLTGQIVKCAGAGEVTTLMPVGTDPHDYSPSSQDMASMVSADLVIANGLGLEEGLAQSIESATSDGATVFEVAPQLDPLPFGENGSQDPHVWHDVTRAAKASGLIGAELTKATGNPDFAECGTLLQGELMTVNDEVAATLAKVPEERRVLVTDHDALGYLAAAYGYTVAGTVIPGGSTLAEPSSAELAALAATVQQAGVPAVFANTANPQALIDALASEVGDVKVVDLYVDSLGEPGSGADSYQGMVRTNAQRISDALAG
jgi:zinc/manganese transport system substrate-binding protein